MKDQQEEENPLINNNDDHETQLINATQTDKAPIPIMAAGVDAGDANALHAQTCHGKAGGAIVDSFCSSVTARPISPFLIKLYDMLSNEETSPFIVWTPTGTSFVIKNSYSFAANVLPMYFRHKNFQSFITQLNCYGFKKISWEEWEYKNEYFQKGGRHLLKYIKRRKQIYKTVQPDFDMEHSLGASPSNNKESTTSMKEYNLLNTELMKLKEKQKTLDEKLASLKDRVAGNERDQGSMIEAAQRILCILREPGFARVPMKDDDGETHVKGKRKLGEITMCPDDVLGYCNGASKANDVAGSHCEIVLVGEEIGKKNESTFISLEDLMGESECIEYVGELQNKTNHPKS